MSKLELDYWSKSVMICINEDTINKLKEFPSIVQKNPVTGEWNTAMVTVEENNNDINPEDDNIQESEGEPDNDDTQESEGEPDNDDTQKNEGKTISIDNSTDLLSSLFYFCIFLMLFNWINNHVYYVQTPCEK
jgi:hypothetical protein